MAASDRDSILQDHAPKFLWIGNAETVSQASGSLFRTFHGDEYAIEHLPLGLDLQLGVGWSGLAHGIMDTEPLHLRRGANDLAMDPANELVFKARALAAEGTALPNAWVMAFGEFGGSGSGYLRAPMTCVS